MSDPENELVVMRVFRNIFDQHLRVDFHCRVICVKLTFANKIQAMYERSRVNVKVEPRSTSFLSQYWSGPGSPRVRESRTLLDSGFHAVDSGFQVLDLGLCQWNLDSGFQLLVGVRIS